MIRLDTSHPKIIFGPRRSAILFQWRPMYPAGNSIPAAKTWTPTMTLVNSWVMLSSYSMSACPIIMPANSQVMLTQPQSIGSSTVRPLGPKMIPTKVARGGSERCRRLRMSSENKAYRMRNEESRR